ncbi:MAG TPA: hypothetical protein VG710_09810, partial [Opitutus sp.]|nr:hypothetical protein [Opitutus sp.]
MPDTLYAIHVRFSAGLLFCCLVAPLACRAAPIPETEALDPPTAARLAAIEASARREGWDRW